MTEKKYTCFLKIHRRVKSQFFLHPVQVSVVQVFKNEATGAVDEEKIVAKLLMRCDGQSRELKVEPGYYAFRAREIPLGCNYQSEEMLVKMTSTDPTCVILKVGSSLQVLLAGFGGCLLPHKYKVKSFMFEHVAPEAYKRELLDAPRKIADIMKKKRIPAAASEEAAAADNAPSSP